MSKPGDSEEVSELRRRLDMAEDELTFLKAVFEEYKDSSAELETELDAQLKDLERSNVALKRENEQIRAQLQATVLRSKKSAEEASNLTTALEAHLEELTKREKKAQNKVRVLEQENEQLKKELESAPAVPAPVTVVQPAGPSVSSAELEAWQKKYNDLTAEYALVQKKLHDAFALQSAQKNKLGNVKTSLVDTLAKMTRLATLTESRFSTVPLQHSVPSLPAEDVDDVETIHNDLLQLAGLIDKAHALMLDTGMARSLVEQVTKMLSDPSHVKDEKLDGQTEIAINKSCLIVLGRLMILGETLPEFKRAVVTLKSSLKDAASQPEGSAQLAHTVLMLAQDIMGSVFDPMREVGQAEKLKNMKEDTLKKIENARLEGERNAKIEAEARLAKEKAEAENKLAKEKAEAEKRIAEVEKLQLSAASSLEQTKREMERLRAESESQLMSARTEAKQLAEKARREALEEASVHRKAIEEEIYQSVAAEMDSLREALERSEAQFTQAAMKQQMYQNSMRNAIAGQSKAMIAAMASARAELDILKRSSQQELAETQRVLNENLNHVRKVARTMAKTDIAQLSMMYERELEMRVKLQDQLQALKGNIRVFCRVRPLLGKEIEDGESEAVSQTNEMTVTAEDPDDPGKPTSFSFDRVFSPDDSQEVVFDEMKTLCLSAMDGFNVCLFAYGITGSGKTFTVEGGENARNNPKQHGLVYRTVREIFRIAFGERAGAYDTEIAVQLLELYNEEFRDLLVDPEYKGPKPDVRIISDVVYVDNVRKVKVDKLPDCIELIKKGYGNRTVKSTNMNSLSSRSHSILTLHLTGTNVKTKKTYAGKLHFVDLAGSERVGKSGVVGEALKEAQAINKSLSALGDVISALSNKDKFIPYRNSPLTKLLQESLGGNSKTVMICNIAPCKHSMSETINSLRFATRAHKVEMGKAKAVEAADNEEVKAIKGKMADLETKFKTGGPAATATKPRTASNADALKAPAPATPRNSSPGRQSTSAKPPAPRK
eukprot:c4213_g2_i1.p1 GENE.c4213_g2_i1~~c4213_g2_i1.p1  ORF type:complete len:1005 (+),score=248.40 c4213_g2_i1:62-3076(+)